MLVEELRRNWATQSRAAPVHAVLSLEREGLVLGAGTVLLPALGKRRLARLEGQEARLLTLLAAAHGRVPSPRTLDHIRRASTCWREGEDCLAGIHLARARLPRLEKPLEASYRLFMAEGLMRQGIPAHTILAALDIDPTGLSGFEKAYDQAELRVPAGSGRGSGEWMGAAFAALGRGVSAALDLAEVSAGAAVELGTFAARFAGPTSAFGLLFVPSENELHVEGQVPELPGLSYVWNRDEATLHLTYQGKGSTRVINASLGLDDVFRDAKGRAVARVLPNDSLAVDPAAISPDLVSDDEPKLCPIPVKDKPGRGEEKGKTDKDYEDQVKRLVNPDNPTPRGFGVVLLNPVTGNAVTYDDCERSTGTMIEAKGPGYAGLFRSGIKDLKAKREWLDQSEREVQASGGRDLRWYIAEPAAADFARQLFGTMGGGRERINIEVLPFAGEISDSMKKLGEFTHGHGYFPTLPQRG
jgi:hypothetical protein